MAVAVASFQVGGASSLVCVHACGNAAAMGVFSKSVIHKKKRARPATTSVGRQRPPLSSLSVSYLALAEHEVTDKMSREGIRVHNVKLAFNMASQASDRIGPNEDK